MGGRLASTTPLRHHEVQGVHEGKKGRKATPDTWETGVGNARGGAQTHPQHNRKYTLRALESGWRGGPTAHAHVHTNTRCCLQSCDSCHNFSVSHSSVFGHRCLNTEAPLFGCARCVGGGQHPHASSTRTTAECERGGPTFRDELGEGDSAGSHCVCWCVVSGCGQLEVG
jgi:hypothetical protein